MAKTTTNHGVQSMNYHVCGSNSDVESCNREVCLTPGNAGSTSVSCRFCCRSPLKAAANNDSLTLMGSAAGSGHDGAVGAGSRAAVLFVLP
jgi:hypothetical protein